MYQAVEFGPVNTPPIFRSALNKGGLNGGSEVITWSNSVIQDLFHKQVEKRWERGWKSC